MMNVHQVILFLDMITNKNTNEKVAVCRGSMKPTRLCIHFILEAERND